MLVRFSSLLLTTFPTEDRDFRLILRNILLIVLVYSCQERDVSGLKRAGERESIDLIYIPAVTSVWNLHIVKEGCCIYLCMDVVCGVH